MFRAFFIWLCRPILIQVPGPGGIRYTTMRSAGGGGGIGGGGGGCLMFFAVLYAIGAVGWVLDLFDPTKTAGRIFFCVAIFFWLLFWLISKGSEIEKKK